MSARPDDWKPKGPFRFWRADFERDTRHLTEAQKWRYLSLLTAMWEAGGWVYETEMYELFGRNWRRDITPILEEYCDHEVTSRSHLGHKQVTNRSHSVRRWTQGRIQQDLDKQWKVPARKSRAVTQSTPPSPSPSPKERKNNPPPLTPEPDRDAAPDGRSIDEDFAEFYRAYPRRVGRAAASKSYRKARKGSRDMPAASAERLLEAARRFAKETRGQEARFIAHPATWLNQGRWQDEPPTNGHDPSGVDWEGGTPVPHPVIRPGMPMPETKPPPRRDH